jgi:hypothetical protein
MPLVGIVTLPTPFSPASVPLPPETGGRGHTSLRVGGWGESQFRRGAYTVVLFICTYFVYQRQGCGFLFLKHRKYGSGFVKNLLSFSHCFGPALVAMRIRIYHFRSLRIRIQIRSGTRSRVLMTKN